MRPEGWEARLSAEIRAAATREFDARQWNCARFAHRVAESVSGRSLAFRRQGSLVASVDAVLPRVERKLAQRGDVVLADVPQASLGVCVGRGAVFVGVGGLLTVPMRFVRMAWSV